MNKILLLVGIILVIAAILLHGCVEKPTLNRILTEEENAKIRQICVGPLTTEAYQKCAEKVLAELDQNKAP